MRSFSLLSFVSFAFLAATSVAAEGLQIEKTHTVDPCNRRTVKGDVLEMHYRGTLASDGKQFDSSYDRGRPLVFELGAGRLIKGVDQGMLGVCVGDKRTLTIPPELAYGDRETGPIPAGSTLVFETELVGIQGVSKDEL